MDKLAEIKTDVQSFELSLKGQAYPGIKTLLDDIKRLLPIVEAAAEYKRDGGYEPMAKLFDALKALE